MSLLTFNLVPRERLLLNNSVPTDPSLFLSHYNIKASSGGTDTQNKRNNIQIEHEMLDMEGGAMCCPCVWCCVIKTQNYNKDAKEHKRLFYTSSLIYIYLSCGQKLLFSSFAIRKSFDVFPWIRFGPQFCQERVRLSVKWTTLHLFLSFFQHIQRLFMKTMSWSPPAGGLQ